MMTKVPVADRAVRLAGFALARAALSIADRAGPCLPQGVVERPGLLGGKRVMMLFTYPTAAACDLGLSVRLGRSEVEAKLPEFSSSAFVYDGYSRYAEQKVDALIVEANDVTMEMPIKVI